MVWNVQCELFYNLIPKRWVGLFSQILPWNKFHSFQTWISMQQKETFCNITKCIHNSLFGWVGWEKMQLHQNLWFSYLKRIHCIYTTSHVKLYKTYFCLVTSIWGQSTSGYYGTTMPLWVDDADLGELLKLDQDKPLQTCVSIFNSIKVHSDSESYILICTTKYIEPFKPISLYSIYTNKSPGRKTFSK